METSSIVKTSFFISLITTFTGAFIFSQYREYNMVLFIAAILASLIFMVSAIYEINKSLRITQREKTWWTIGFILGTGMVGLIYMLGGRKRIVG